MSFLIPAIVCGFSFLCGIVLGLAVGRDSFRGKSDPTPPPSEQPYPRIYRGPERPV